MASLKRYKQPSDHNNRSQDIPPRFKRQKSFTSCKPQTTMESENQNSPLVQKKKSTWGDSLTSTWASSSSHQKGCSTPREGRKIVKKISTQKAQLNAEKTLLKPATSQPFVLSPMENKLFSLTRNDAECENDNFVNTYQSCSDVNDQFGLHIKTQQSVSQSDSFNNNGSTKSYYAAGQNSPNSFNWCESNPAKAQFNSNTMQQQYSPTQTMGSQVDYSDPDIRTIEMLRELERVADQTDVGSDETANDKNSLVSHHLRMLMCAVDRYTQGVEEDQDDSSQEDETLPQEDVRSSPSPTKTPIKDSSLNQKQVEHFSPLANTQYNSFNSFENNPSCHQFSPFAAHSAITNYSTQPMENNMLNPWNLWTSPTFNSLDVYASTNLPDVHNASHPSIFMPFAGDRCY